MSERGEAELRLDLARGHWGIGERSEAVTCLERCAKAQPDVPQLLELAESFLSECGEGEDEWVAARLAALCEELVPPQSEPPELVGPALASPTLARVLAEQGHVDRAREVADRVLARNPEDARALEVRSRLGASEQSASSDSAPRVAELERWLRNLRRRFPELETVG